MPSDIPFAQVREFYLTRYRPLYDHFVTNGEVPQELHAEVAAAFDHLLRVALDGEKSLRERESAKVVAHIKRATFDAFKVLFRREIREQYDRLHTAAYADVDNGDFLVDVHAAWVEASAIATEARRLETASGDINTEGWHAAFDKWNEIIPYAEKFSEWALSKKVAHAAAKHKRGVVFSIVWSIALTVFGTVLGCVLPKLWHCFAAP
jgi:hypothetical protein